MTVSGPVPARQLGQMLPHEHVLVDFIGADKVSRDRYNRKKVFDKVEPYLKQLAVQGCQTLVDCTPAYLGRDALLLRQLSEATGLNLLTNTGYYGAVNNKYLPEHAYTDTADELAGRWVQEWDQGIRDTGIRPGFIKIGVDEGPLSAVDEKLVRAACRTHLQTGLTIAVHTGPAVAAFEQLAVLEEEGVHPQAWIWVHAQNENDLSHHLEAGKRGGWVSLDGFSTDQTHQYVQMVSKMKAHGLLHRVLVSQDNGWYQVGEPDGGTFQPYHELFTNLLPALQQAGFSKEEIYRLVTVNPQRAFTVQVHKA